MPYIHNQNMPKSTSGDRQVSYMTTMLLIASVFQVPVVTIVLSYCLVSGRPFLSANAQLVVGLL
jgi:hypothetical protein